MSRRLPDVLTWSRMLVALALPALPGTVPALLAYLWCGLSDVLDGYLARRWGVAGDRGARLDSVADLVFWTAVLCWLLLRTDLLTGWVLLGVGAVAVIRLASAGVLRHRTGHGGGLHTRANKVAGLLVFATVPVAMLIGPAVWLLAPVLVVAAIAAIEELTLVATRAELTPDDPGVL